MRSLGSALMGGNSLALERQSRQHNSVHTASWTDVHCLFTIGHARTRRDLSCLARFQPPPAQTMQTKALIEP